MNLPKRGLTLGKFAPLHHGHQLLIETACAEMDRVIVLVYDCPDVTPIPLTVRANWIRRLYPQVQVIEAWDGPMEVGDTPDIKQKHEDYVLKQLQIKDITHFYSSEFYGEHMSLALGAVNRLVDCDRTQIPISATQIRANPFQYRHFLDPLVYRDLITNIVFLGAPSTGKTTIAQTLAERYNTAWMPEYGREYWEKYQRDRRLTPAQLVEIAEGHLEREQAKLLQANQYLFTDTNAITTYLFALAYHQLALPRLTELATQVASRYDLVFLCEADIPYDDTWDRSGDANRQVFQKQIVTDLITRKIPFFRLRGDLETRVRLVQRVLQQYRKYENLGDIWTL